MDITLEELDIKLGHMGINVSSAEEARSCVDLMASLFGLAENKAKDTAGACFTGAEIEWLKGGGHGKYGHFSISTTDLPKARTYFESQGVVFDDASIKYAPDGKIDIIYATTEIAGYAWHLLQR